MGIYFRNILLIRITRGANNCIQCVFEKNIYLIMIFPPTLSSYYSMKSLIFVKKKKKKIKRIKNAETFSQPSLIIFNKGANIFGHDCMSNCSIYVKSVKRLFSRNKM